MMELESLARHVEDVGAALTETAGRVERTGVASRAFGAAATGAVGELGLALSGLAAGALRSRAAEARALGQLAAGLATLGRRAAGDYRGTDAGRGGS